MAKPEDLALQADFEVGPLRVSPARRRIEGPAGKASLEPLIMQVLLILLRSNGRVVTRTELFDDCWGGVMVGDDSLNRAVGKVRKTIAEVAPGLVEIETIPRTGYRVTGDIPETPPAQSRPAPQHGRISRRALLGSAAAAAVVLGGAGFLILESRQRDRFDKLMEKGVGDLEYGEVSQEPVALFRQAAELRPNDARPHGLLAFSLLMNAETAFNRGAGANVDEAQAAMSRALSIDPRQPEALLAKVALDRSVLDMDSTETRLREVLAISPGNFFAMRDLWNVLQCGGRSLEALALVEKAIAQKPLAASANYPWAQLLWITGQVAEADRVIDRAMLYWPSHRFVRFARFMIFAFTGRPEAALAMLESKSSVPQNFSDASVDLWKILLPALQTRSAAAVSAARRESLDRTQKNPGLTAQSVMTLSVLGDLDSAFEIADKLLLFRPPAAPKGEDSKALPVSTAWRFTPWLFTPPCAAMRLDPRFAELAEGIGLTDYWRKRGVRPDAFLFAR